MRSRGPRDWCCHSASNVGPGGRARRRLKRGESCMSAISSERPTVTVVESTPAADPAPLGLAGFALTTFLLSGHNASFIPDLIWVGFALFYGGMAQFAAGMWEFRNRNVFGATAFSTYGGFWMGIGIFVILALDTKLLAGYAPNDLNNALARRSEWARRSELRPHEEVSRLGSV